MFQPVCNHARYIFLHVACFVPSTHTMPLPKAVRTSVQLQYSSVHIIFVGVDHPSNLTLFDRLLSIALIIIFSPAQHMHLRQHMLLLASRAFTTPSPESIYTLSQLSTVHIRSNRPPSLLAVPVTVTVSARRPVVLMLNKVPLPLHYHFSADPSVQCDQCSVRISATALERPSKPRLLAFKPRKTFQFLQCFPSHTLIGNSCYIRELINC